MKTPNSLALTAESTHGALYRVASLRGGSLDKITKGSSVDVEIEKLTYGGAGLARINGQVVFVDYTAPGDRVTVKIVEAKKNFLRGEVSKILIPSPVRTEPRCSVFGRCGGCQWQHLNYQAQVDTKQSILKEVLHRFFPDQSITLAPMKESPSPYSYRNRIQVRAEKGQVGYYAKSSHELVPITECNIAEEKINQELRKLLQSEPSDGKYRIQHEPRGGVCTYPIEEVDEPLGFAQINSAQNENLQKAVLTAYQSYVGRPVIDLYGGYGNLAIPLAERHPQVSIECVEWSRMAVAEGLRLAKERELKNLQFVQADVAAYLQRLAIPQKSFVILDPPRQGCDAKVLWELAVSAPDVLIYVSCDPMTWGRDAQFLQKEARQRGHHYRIATIQGLDMFPQTDHIEVFSIFERTE